MSKARYAAIVCEGQTDVPILRAAVQAIWPVIEEVRCLQPELDEMERAKGPAGWTMVKAWCEQNRDRLDDILNPPVGDPIDLLLIAVDIDVAIDAGIADPPQRVGVYEATRLRNTIASWVVPSVKARLPSTIMITTPVMAIEAWIIAALFSRERAPEAIDQPAHWLVEKGKLKTSPRDGQPWKELHRYRAFAPAVARNIARVRKRCTEAERILHRVEKLRDGLRS